MNKLTEVHRKRLTVLIGKVWHEIVPCDSVDMPGCYEYCSCGTFKLKVTRPHENLSFLTPDDFVAVVMALNGNVPNYSIRELQNADFIERFMVEVAEDNGGIPVWDVVQ